MPQPRIPNSIHKINGTYREDRHGSDLPLGEPPRTTPAPDSLGTEGKRIWDSYRDLLIEKGILTNLDAEAFYLLCESFDNVAMCRLQMKCPDDFFQITQRGITRHPLAVQRDAFVKEQARLLQKFGLTPSERGGLKIREKSPVPFRPKP